MGGPWGPIMAMKFPNRQPIKPPKYAKNYEREINYITESLLLNNEDKRNFCNPVIGFDS
ncbi:15687_t:CDS:2 [Entrophospora sp. SA101]|nr:15687_t:CDS:2 [Entrophospora sp. SA101]